MTGRIDPTRRTVLKTIGAGVIGSATVVGTASGHGEPTNNRRQDSFTWGEGELYEMLESEPHPPTNDSEGNHHAHRPLWLIASMAGTGVDGAEHSPHPNPMGLPVDHVVPVPGEGGGTFSAQWHVHLVTDEPFDFENPFSNLANVTRTDADGAYLTSAEAITSANGIFVTPLFDPETGEPDVFTCPVRPHKGPGVDRG